MRRFGLEPIWTAEDTRNAVLASLIPGATAFTAFAVFANDRSVVEWWTRAKKPDWAPKDPLLYSVLDVATLSPLGYASYLVYKNGGGLQYTDTKLALGLYGLNMVFALTTIPLIKKRSFTALFRNTVLLNAAAVGAAFAFYKIDRTAGQFMLPYAIWTGFYAMLTYSMSKENVSKLPKVFIAWIAGFRMGSDGPNFPNEGNIVYRKADLEDAESEDVWDDSALIKMYDEMINQTYWHVGDHCMAPYYNDQLWYPAVVKKLDLDGGKCDVLYDVYDELARVSIADLTKKLHTTQSFPLVGRRHRWLSFPRFAMRPTNCGSGQQQRQSQQCRKRKTKQYRSNWLDFMQMESGEKRRRMHQQAFTASPNTASFQRSFSFNLPRTVYLMRVLDNLRHQKPVENDEEGTSEGNTTQETFDAEEKLSQTNHVESLTKQFNYAQSSSADQHTSIPPLVPPPPIAFNNLSPPRDDEALASMLMSWYMTGYHTGYYQAIQDKKKNAKKV